ncbi:hypothetical protein [Streptomyces sp. NPDC093707]|uniref:DUF7848 domain-containing protein n=1 Tax=Streptomyces sp. NPDC093707 TaxID=3154984 RepID=UPI00344D80E1
MSERESLEWTLRDRAKLGLRHVGKCQECGEFCMDTPHPEKAREWCLRHVEDTGHVFYELTAFELLRAARTKRPERKGSSPA